MTIFEASEIKKAVAERYGKRARNAAAAAEAEETIPLAAVSRSGDPDDACCGPDAPSADEVSFIKGLYAETETAGLPPGALEAAAGCGNPTAIAELRPGETVIDLGSGGGIDCFLAARQVGPAGRGLCLH